MLRVMEDHRGCPFSRGVGEMTADIVHGNSNRVEDANTIDPPHPDHNSRCEVHPVTVRCRIDGYIYLGEHACTLSGDDVR